MYHDCTRDCFCSSLFFIYSRTVRTVYLTISLILLMLRHHYVTTSSFHRTYRTNVIQNTHYLRMSIQTFNTHGEIQLHCSPYALSARNCCRRSSYFVSSPKIFVVVSFPKTCCICKNKFAISEKSNK